MVGKKFFVYLFICTISLLPAAALADNSCISEGCHSKLLDNKFVHGPVAVGECSHCHSQTAKHSFKPAGAGDVLCADCHELKIKGTQCVKCHDPHGSGREFHLKNNSAGRCAK